MKVDGTPCIFRIDEDLDSRQGGVIASQA